MRSPHEAIILLIICAVSAMAQVDRSKTILVSPFESAVQASPGFLDATRTSVLAYLKDDNTFPRIVESANSGMADKAGMLELTARLTEFKAGSMATRVLVGLGSGRASAEVEFALKDLQSGNVVWKKTIKEKASVWSNNASSAAQRMELPEKIAATLVKELRGRK